MRSRPLKSASLATVALATVVAFVLPVLADAPISGDARQYDNFSGSDPTIKDRKTQLLWERPVAPKQIEIVTLDKTTAHCNAVGPGYRLPTVKELLTLVDEEPHAEYFGVKNEPRYIDKRAFEKTPGVRFWTSSKVPDTQGGTYTVDFVKGFVSRETGNGPLAIRCVK